MMSFGGLGVLFRLTPSLVSIHVKKKTQLIILGFIPSPTKIESIRSNQRGRNLRSTKISAKSGSSDQNRQVLYEKEGASKKESKTCYEVVPNVRPIVMVGPSLKGYEVTDMMQKAVFDFIRRRFDGRVNITRISAGTASSC